MKYLKILYRLLVYFTSLTVCSGDIKKSSENEKKYSENDLSSHLQSFFLLFFPSPDPKSEKKNSRKSTNKKNPGLRGDTVYI